MKTHIVLALSLAACCAAPSLSAQLPPVPTPPGNPTTADKINLGKTLFWDEQLSSTRTVACGTCHMPDGGGADPRTPFSVHPGPDKLFNTADDIFGSPGVPLSTAAGIYVQQAEFGIDVQVTGRSAPTVINAAFNSEQFWDGREGDAFNDPTTGAPLLPSLASLENQAQNPPLGDSEMAHQGRSWVDCADRIKVSMPLALAADVPATLSAWIGNQTYPQLFNLVYGTPDVTGARIIMAIAAYERILISDQTPFDLNQLTPLQQQGLDLFNDKARCHLCHEGPLFRDNTYHNIGLRPSAEDPGRFNVTANPADMGAFKTTGMRNVGLKKAFMHNGIHKSLAEVIDFYDRGGDFFGNIDPKMQPLGLTIQEKVALLDFLQNGLTDPRVAGKLPPFDPPTLYSQTTNVPTSYGQGAPGTGNAVPRLIAIEPPVQGNPNFTIALADGLGNAPAAIAFDTFMGFGLQTLGVPIWVAGSASLLTFPIGNLQGAGGGGGYWSATFDIPAGVIPSGTTLFLQAYVGDAGAAQGISGTAGLQFTLFDPR